jgi:hypothetical protein
MRQVTMHGLRRVDGLFELASAAHNLRRMRRLIPLQAQV